MFTFPSQCTLPSFFLIKIRTQIDINVKKTKRERMFFYNKYKVQHNYAALFVFTCKHKFQ